MKRKAKRFNGESGSVVNDETLSDEDKRLLNITLKEMRSDVGESSEDEDSGTTAEFKRSPKLGGEKSETATGSIPSSKKTSFGEAFAAARAKALRGGPKTFEWEGKTYGTALKGEASPKKSAPKTREVSKADSLESVEYKSTPVKTTKEKIEETISRTPLRNPRGGLDIANALRRNQEVGTEAMRESGRQARVDRIRRNVGSNLETYGMKKGGKVSSASSRADGIAQRGKTRGKLR